MDGFFRVILNIQQNCMKNTLNSYPLAPERKVVKEECMSDYQKSLTIKDKNNNVMQELQVLFERGYETEARAQGAGVRTRTLDGAVHPDEYRIQKKTQRATWKRTFTSS